MAGAGYKLFVNGNTLSASDLNTYVQQQTVMVFASASARTTALSGVLSEGMVSYRLDSHVLEVYNGTIWEATETVLTTKGDLVAFDTAPTRLPVGSNAQVLTADSTQTTGMKWATPSAGMTNPMTTTGDTIYSSSGSTPARLGIGSTGQVLTVAGGVPTWATAGGNLNLSSLASGSLTSGTSLTISSLTADFMQLTIQGFTCNTANEQLQIQLNGDSTASYYKSVIWDQTASTQGAYFYNSSPGFYFVNGAPTNTNASNYYIVTLQNCKSTGFTTAAIQSYYNGTVAHAYVLTGSYQNAAQITSLKLMTGNSATFTAGTYSLIGG